MSCDPQFLFPKRPIILAICEFCGASLLKSALGRHIEQRHPQESLAARIHPRPSPKPSTSSGSSCGSSDDDPRRGRVFSDHVWRPGLSRRKKAIKTFFEPVKLARDLSPPPRPPSPLRTDVTEDLPLLGNTIRKSPSPTPEIPPDKKPETKPPPPIPVKDMISFDPRATSALAALMAREEAAERKDAEEPEISDTPQPGTGRVILTARRKRLKSAEEEFGCADSKSLPINKTDGEVSVISVPKAAALREPEVVLPCQFRSYLHEELCGFLSESEESEEESESSGESSEESSCSPVEDQHELPDDDPCSTEVKEEITNPESPLAVAVKEEEICSPENLPVVKTERLDDDDDDAMDEDFESELQNDRPDGSPLEEAFPFVESDGMVKREPSQESDGDDLMLRLSLSLNGEPGLRFRPALLAEGVSPVCDFAVEQRAEASVPDYHQYRGSFGFTSNGSCGTPPIDIKPTLQDEPLSKMLDGTAFFQDPAEAEHDRSASTAPAHSGEVIDGCYFGSCGSVIKSRIQLAKRTHKLRQDMKAVPEEPPVEVKIEPENYSASPQGIKLEPDDSHEYATPGYGTSPASPYSDIYDQPTEVAYEVDIGGEAFEGDSPDEDPLEGISNGVGSWEEPASMPDVGEDQYYIVSPVAGVGEDQYYIVPPVAARRGVGSPVHGDGIEDERFLPVEQVSVESGDGYEALTFTPEAEDGYEAESPNAGGGENVVIKYEPNSPPIDLNLGRITYYPTPIDPGGVSIPGTSFIILPSSNPQPTFPPYQNGTASLTVNSIKQEEEYETKVLESTIRRMKMRALQPTNVPACSSMPSSTAGPACDRYTSVDELLSGLLTEPPDKKLRVGEIRSESSAESSPSQEDQKWSQRVQQPGQLRHFQQPVVKPLVTSPSER